ncbi:MAG: FAD-dependent oxidoreductase, partial [Clostridiaceae bacterium]|nr:FAD-dependent oxidoreductase [Clostridiaceae bacterium]
MRRTIEYEVDLAVIGGGLAGLCAAVQAARLGCKVLLMQDRPMPGGNASSEVRMWPRGCPERDLQETGLIEELFCENMWRNPTRNYSLWDSVMYGMARNEPNLTLLLNTTCIDGERELIGHLPLPPQFGRGETAHLPGVGPGADLLVAAATNPTPIPQYRLVSVTGWQLTTYSYHRVKARYFADCSGDSVLAELSGALYRVGREAADEFNENLAPPQTDRKTMGNSIILNARETDRNSTFEPPAWAEKYPDESRFNHREHDMREPTLNYWWIELGGDRDTLTDAEDLRDELLATTLGVWDHIKNHGADSGASVACAVSGTAATVGKFVENAPNQGAFAVDPLAIHNADKFELDWLGFLPGKRESRRYVGPLTLTQSDLQEPRCFPDEISHGGWPLDDHHPGGFTHPGNPNHNGPVRAPYGI